MSDENEIVPGKCRPRQRDDEPTRPIIRESSKLGSGAQPDRTMDLAEEEVEILADEESLKGEQTKPIRIPKGPPPPPPPGPTKRSK